jgi:hypothetical protein
LEQSGDTGAFGSSYFVAFELNGWYLRGALTLPTGCRHEQTNSQIVPDHMLGDRISCDLPIKALCSDFR